MTNVKEKLNEIGEIMESLTDDTTIPRNIRRAVQEAKDKIAEEGDIGVNVTTAIYTLDDISNDINMPFHARTNIWSIVSELEALKTELK